jgi:hypothetical protein
MRFLAALLIGSLLGPAALAAQPDPRPGYGVVESVTPLRPQESASAGASAPAASKRGAVYLVRVRMNDGGVQIRQVKKTRYSVGDKVLLTNAGDVVPD